MDFVQIEIQLQKTNSYEMSEKFVDFEKYSSNTDRLGCKF